MRYRLIRLALLAIAALMPTAVDIAWADEAVVLPKGLFQMRTDVNFYFDFGNRWDRDGNLVGYGAALNRSLNFGPAGLSFGRSSGSVTRQLNEVFIQGAYGLTNRLSIAFILPYYYMTNRVNVSVDGSPTTGGAQLGFTAAGAPCSLLAPGCMQSTIPNINALLQSQFGMKPIQTWQDDGPGDLIVGGRYQYYTSDRFRAAFTGGARFPTGKTADPDDVISTNMGIGTYALLAQLQNDYMSQAPGLSKVLGFPNPGEYFVNFTVRYEYRLPDRQTLRVCPGGGVLCPASFKENVHRKVGDVFEVEVGPKIGLFIPGLMLNPLYRFGYKWKDYHTGNMGLDYGDLGNQLDNLRTNYEEHIFIISLQYTTTPLYLQKKFPLPLAFYLNYRDRFAGSGGVPDSKYIGFTAQAFF